MDSDAADAAVPPYEGVSMPLVVFTVRTDGVPKEVSAYLYEMLQLNLKQKKLNPVTMKPEAPVFDADVRVLERHIVQLARAKNRAPVWHGLKVDMAHVAQVVVALHLARPVFGLLHLGALPRPHTDKDAANAAGEALFTIWARDAAKCPFTLPQVQEHAYQFLRELTGAPAEAMKKHRITVKSLQDRVEELEKEKAAKEHTAAEKTKKKEDGSKESGYAC